MEKINGIHYLCHYDSRDEMERTAPRKCGSIVQTPHVTWCFDGKDWTVLYMEQYITFNVVKRLHIAGRGYVTVIHNPDRLPIDCDKSAICKGQFRLPIHGIERTMTLMTIPKVKPHWGLVTSEETVGDWLIIRMYPDEVDEPENVKNL